MHIAETWTNKEAKQSEQKCDKETGKEDSGGWVPNSISTTICWDAMVGMESDAYNCVMLVCQSKNQQYNKSFSQLTQAVVEKRTNPPTPQKNNHFSGL